MSVFIVGNRVRLKKHIDKPNYFGYHLGLNGKYLSLDMIYTIDLVEEDQLLVRLKEANWWVEPSTVELAVLRVKRNLPSWF